jgi:Icc-related predicted phosphoesterase
MKLFTVAAIEGSTGCFRKFLKAVGMYKADAAVLLGDLTGRQVVSVIQRGHSLWEAPVDGRIHRVESRAELAEVTTFIANRGDYWLEQTPEEYERLVANPAMVDLYFKSLARQRLEEWLQLADEWLNESGPPVFIAPGSGDSPIIDALFESGSKLLPCDDRIVQVGGYELVTSSASGRSEWELVREMDDRALYNKLLNLCSRIGDPDFAVLNLQADGKVVKRILKRFQPLVCFTRANQGTSGGVSSEGKTLWLTPRTMVKDEAQPALSGILLELRDGVVHDHFFTEG